MLLLILMLLAIVLVCVVISMASKKSKLTDMEIERMKGAGKTNASGNDSDRYETLAKLKKLLDDGVLSQEEYEIERKKVLARD